MQFPVCLIAGMRTFFFQFIFFYKIPSLEQQYIDNICKYIIVSFQGLFSSFLVLCCKKLFLSIIIYQKGTFLHQILPCLWRIATTEMIFQTRSKEQSNLASLKGETYGTEIHSFRRITHRPIGENNGAGF